MTAAMSERNARVTATSSVLAYCEAAPLSHKPEYFRALLKVALKAPAESAPSEPDPWKVIEDVLAETSPEEKPNPEVTPESAACKSESVPEEKQ